MRALLVVNCQVTWRSSVLVASMPAMLSQLPCLWVLRFPIIRTTLSGSTRRRRGASRVGVRPTRRSSRCRGGRIRSSHGGPAPASLACQAGHRQPGSLPSPRRTRRCRAAGSSSTLSGEAKAPPFSDPPDRGVVHRRYPLRQEHMLLEQSQRPALTPRRWLAARQRDQPGLNSARHLRLHRRRRPLLAADHLLDPATLGRERLCHQVHGALRRTDPLGHPPGGQARRPATYPTSATPEPA